MSPRLVLSCASLLLAVGLACGAATQETAAPASAAAATTEPSAPAARPSTPADDEGPVAVPQPSQKALDYYRSGNLLWVVETLWGLLVPAVLLFTGFSAGLRTLAKKVGRKWLFVVVIYAVVFTAVTFLLDLPLAYYTEFVRQHAYGLSNQTLAKWTSDTLKSLMISLIVAALVIPVIYLFLRKSPRRWWLWSGLAAVPFIVLVLLVSPIWIAPLFNKFGPMKDEALEAKILALAHRAGIEGGRVYEVDKSVDTKAVNAYVTGFGQTKRIVLWDTIIAKLDSRELLFVMGHEMGHYVLGHVPKSIAFFSLLILATFYAAHRTAGGVISRWRARIGFSELSDVASYPLILLLAGLFSLVVTPMTMAYSRWQEHQADRFGLEITRDNHDAATAFVKLQTENLGNPRPGWLYKLWRSSHPPIGERIDFCNSYHPWRTGQPLAYERLFKAATAKTPAANP
jgi:STE24 endopeptidase